MISGVALTVTTEINKLLEPLRQQFRRDLALVCESHHLDDLYDIKKYKVSQPYGNSDAETANVQYAAVLLRATDLLNITPDRTPSVVFRVINPVDPLSQQEWAKQMAVTRVRSKVGIDQEGKPDDEAPRDTIEVHAYFTNEDGFFGLTSYLKYGADQLRKCYDWVELARKSQGTSHEFPWRSIDDNNIETEGFLRDTFEFTIDQAKILDLLTGHTLYNDTKVVLRELVQNSLDAIRLQAFIDEQKGVSGEPGKISIHWDSSQHILSVEDNGTGMTQDIIVRHLLRVGSSRYQDPHFRKIHPGFTSISRFGIGVLSAFMVADTVEITTVHPDDDKARQLSLRSVQGKYLVRMLDKQSDIISRMGKHGTIVKLKVRSSADLPDIVESAQRWIVVPDCDVTVSIDNGPSLQVGFSSPKEALLDTLQKNGILTDGTAESKGSRRVKVKEKEVDGCTVAYAVEWSEYFNEWTFLDFEDLRTAENLLLGTCVGGIRVEFNTPGFEKRSIIAIANVKGSNTPRTNVVRSGLEMTPERDIMLQTIYSIYCDHVRDEINELCTKRRFSLTWASQESKYILSPLLLEPENVADLSDKQVLKELVTNSGLLTGALETIPIFLVERDGRRQAVSSADLRGEKVFWTIDSRLFKSAEWLLREVPGDASLSSLVNFLHINDLRIPDHAPVLCGYNASNSLDKTVFAGKEVDLIMADSKQRRVDLRWAEKTDTPRWREVPIRVQTRVRRAHRVMGYSYRARSLWLIGTEPSEVNGLTDEVVVNTSGICLVLANSWLANQLNFLFDSIQNGSEDALDASVIAHFFMTYIFEGGRRIYWMPDDFEVGTADDFVSRMLSEVRASGMIKIKTERLRNLFDFVEFANRLMRCKLFDPSAWKRAEN